MFNLKGISKIFIDGFQIFPPQFQQMANITFAKTKQDVVIINCENKQKEVPKWR